MFQKLQNSALYLSQFLACEFEPQIKANERRFVASYLRSSVVNILLMVRKAFPQTEGFDKMLPSTAGFKQFQSIIKSRELNRRRRFSFRIRRLAASDLGAERGI